MFPNQYNDFQSMAQLMAFRELGKMWEEIKESRKEKKKDKSAQPLIQLTWFCLGKLGLGLSRLGRFVEQVGLRIIWFVMRKKAESSPDYHN